MTDFVLFAQGNNVNDTVNNLNKTTQDAWLDLQAMTPQLLSYATNAVGALILLIIAWILAGMIAGLVATNLRRAKVDETLTRFFAKATKWLIIVLAVLACLGLFGVETTSFAAVIGAAGLAVGLAFQGTLSNFAAGVMLLIFRPFNVGDVVNVAGYTAKVYAIDIFTTTLDTFDNRRIFVPNGSVFGQTIENITYHPHRRTECKVGVSYTAGIDRTREVLEAATKSVEGGLEEPAPMVVLNGLGDSAVNWTAYVWAPGADFLGVQQGLIRAVKTHLDEAGIEIPFPQMDVHLDKQES